MTTLALQGGASVHARDRIPSTDLSSLLAFLVEAFPPEDQPSDARSWPALSYDPNQKRLCLNTYGILRRFFAHRGMRARFAHSDDSGFLRDFGGIPKRLTIKMGGRLFNSDFAGVSRHVSELQCLIEDELDRLDIVPEKILVADPAAVMATLAEKMRLKSKLDQQQATLVPIEFAAASRSSAVREKDVARVISALEEIQGEDWLTRLASSTVQAMTRRDDEFDEVQQEILRETLRQDFEKPDSQITRFLNFLEDDALARVRLYVSFAIMEAVASLDGAALHGARKELHNYVRRVIALFDLYATPEAENTLHLDLSGDFGLDADFSLADELVRAGFYACLPVWAEWNTQLFETRRADRGSTAVSVLREVNYRFRVNGRDASGRFAFDARLRRLRRTLLEDADLTLSNSFQRRRCLAQVVFLWLALNSDLDPAVLDEHAMRLAKRLRDEGKDGVAMLLDDLDAWSGRVRTLGATLVGLLRSKSPRILSQAQQATSDLYLVVQESLVNWAAIGNRRGKASEPLVKPDAGRAENVEWFKYIKVARQPDAVPEPLFSVRIRTHLRERTLAARENEVAAVAMRRELPDALLNVVWQPIQISEARPPTVALRTTLDPTWRMGPGVDIQYDPMLLTPRRTAEQKHTELDRQQYRTSGVAAFTVLVYVFLQVLAARLAKASGNRIPIVMLRFQTQGREASVTDGDTSIYAAAHAVEAALMRDTPVRMQGMVCTPEDTARQYKEMGTAFALSSAFPLLMSMPTPSAVAPGAQRPAGTVTGRPVVPAVPKVALLVYCTRPCDEHPEYHYADGYIFRVKTYLADAEAGSSPGYRLSFDCMQSHVVESRDEFKSPTLIVEEISRLHRSGYDHILLLSSHFGNRRINRSAQRHSPHTRTVFLDDIATKFPAVKLYMLRRDVFPAMRLHLRQRYRESGFEAVRLADHQEFAIQPADGLLKQLIPAYTFATLSIVGTDEIGRPQSGFCTYFLDTDYQVRNLEWSEQARANILGTNPDVRASLVAVLRGLHFLEAEQQPEGTLVRAVLDPFDWINPDKHEAAGEVQAVGYRKTNGGVLLSLPALLSHVTQALHSRSNR
jgi:hypothetical protein